jgi:hypothetical protein
MSFKETLGGLWLVRALFSTPQQPTHAVESIAIDLKPERFIEPDGIWT